MTLHHSPMTPMIVTTVRRFSPRTFRRSLLAGGCSWFAVWLFVLMFAAVFAQNYSWVRCRCLGEPNPVAKTMNTKLILIPFASSLIIWFGAPTMKSFLMTDFSFPRKFSLLQPIANATGSNWKQLYPVKKFHLGKVEWEMDNKMIMDFLGIFPWLNPKRRTFLSPFISNRHASANPMKVLRNLPSWEWDLAKM